MTELTVPDWREEHRYGIYAVRDEECPDCGGDGREHFRGGIGALLLGRETVEADKPCSACRGEGHRFQPVLVACADTKEAVGTAIITQGEDALEVGVPPESLGVADGERRIWLAMPCWAVGRGRHV